MALFPDPAEVLFVPEALLTFAAAFEAVFVIFALATVPFDVVRFFATVDFFAVVDFFTVARLAVTCDRALRLRPA